MKNKKWYVGFFVIFKRFLRNTFKYEKFYNHKLNIRNLSITNFKIERGWI